MNNKRLYSILFCGKTTEKSVRLADKYKQLTFSVKRNSTKIEIKYAVEKIFNVLVDKTRIINVKGKVKKFKQIEGRRSSWKKAIVSLKEGHDINLAEFE